MAFPLLRDIFVLFGVAVAVSFGCHRLRVPTVVGLIVAGVIAVMEWLVQAHGLPLRNAKVLVEKAVKYSEGEGLEEVSYRSLEKAQDDMKVRVSISKDEHMEKIQKPESILFPTRSIGMPFIKRMDENMASLQKRIKAHKNWLLFRRRDIQKATSLVARMEKQLGGSPAS